MKVFVLALATISTITACAPGDEVQEVSDGSDAQAWASNSNSASQQVVRCKQMPKGDGFSWRFESATNRAPYTYELQIDTVDGDSLFSSKLIDISVGQFLNGESGKQKIVGRVQRGDSPGLVRVLSTDDTVKFRAGNNMTVDISKAGGSFGVFGWGMVYHNNPGSPGNPWATPILCDISGS